MKETTPGFVSALEDPRYVAPYGQLRAVCKTAGRPMPQLRVVDRLPWSRETMTASASTRNGEVIFVPLALLDRISSDALESLLGHELGHLVLKGSKWLVWRKASAALVAIAVLAAMCCFGLGIGTGHDGLILSGVACLILGVMALPLMQHFNRIHEREADAYAVRVIGIRGMEELMKHNAKSRNQPERQPLMERVFESHPHPSSRLNEMRAYAEELIRKRQQ